MQPSVPPVDLPYLDLFRAKGRLFAYYRRDGRRVRLLDAAGVGRPSRTEVPIANGSHGNAP